MYLTKIILLITHLQINCEWVEISQQYYRKYDPPKHSSDLNSRRVATQEQIVPHSPSIYDNRTINDVTWSKGNVHRIQNMGIIKQVQKIHANTSLSESIFKRNFDHKSTSKIEDVEKERVKNLTESVKSYEASDTENKKTEQKNASAAKNENDDTHYQEDEIRDTTNKNKQASSILNISNKDRIESVIKFLKIIAETITRNTHNSFKSKIKYLQELQNSILFNIGKFNSIL